MRGCCAAKDSPAVLEAFRREIERLGLKGRVRVNKSGCLDQCANGPTVVIYPEGTWYGRVSAGDAAEIVRAMMESRVVERLSIKRETSKT